MLTQNMMIAVPHQTWSGTSFWGNPRSSECSACGSLIGPGSAAGPSDEPQTVSLPEDKETDTHSHSTKTHQRLHQVRIQYYCIWAWVLRKSTHSELALAYIPQLVISSALLGFQLQDFGLKRLFSGDCLVFYLIDLDKWKTFRLSSLSLCQVTVMSNWLLYIAASTENIDNSGTRYLSSSSVLYHISKIT